MVLATHHQAHRDMAAWTEEAILTPELAGGEASIFFRDGGVVVVERRHRHDGRSSTSTDGSSAPGGDGCGHVAAMAATTCAICLEDSEVGDDDMSVMPCSHSPFISNMDEELRTGFLLGIMCYEELLRQFSEADAQAHADDAAAGDVHLAGAAGADEAPRNNHGYDSRLCAIMDTLYNQDFLRGVDAGLFDDDNLEYIEYDDER
ncbi:hypothetical protein HU200_054420 [Digitaria exilis]|uniref:Uncharacterized protein n=1 Tax=Digitaria exilis TaxID=1010633 RepID=A0A835AKV7_9POAL|nr:hypothetical protein HU200_054420 [Digitaria exilis]